jgi:hypothetical protein
MLTATARQLWIELFIALALVGGVGLTAIGASGLVAAGLGSAFGSQFVAGDPPDRMYTPERCADFAEYHPGAADCRTAAAAHHFDEVVDYRLAAGVLGVLGLGGILALRRRFPVLAGHARLPDGFSATVGASLFGVAAAILLGSGLLGLLFGQTDGVGELLSGGVVSLMVFAVYGLALLRSLLARL